MKALNDWGIDMYSDDDLLLISGIQHFIFCRRQWALIHIEQQWEDNVLTYEGQTLHERSDNPKLIEKRQNILTIRALPVKSYEYGLTGRCDVVEFIEDPAGVHLHGREQTYRPNVVEYKHGKAKYDLSDTLQLLAESMCLEEMLGISIDSGDLFYFETHRRETIHFDDSLRQTLQETVNEMHGYWSKRYTPKVKTGPWCKRCSLANICLPELMKKRSAQKYLEERLAE